MDSLPDSFDIDAIRVHFISDNTVEGAVSLREYIDYSEEQIGKYAETLAGEIAETVALLLANPTYTNIGRAIFSNEGDDGEYLLFLDRPYNPGDKINVDELGGGIRH